MNLTMTRFQLFDKLTQAGGPVIHLPDGSVGSLVRVEREDGSGRKFNLTVRLKNHELKDIFVQVTD